MKSRKKLTIISVSGIKNFVGGAETFSEELTKRLRGRGHKIIKLFAVSSRDWNNIPEIKNEYYYRLGRLNIFDINIVGIFSLINKLRYIIKTSHPDLIYLHLYQAPLAVALFDKVFKIPKITHTYGVWYKEYESSKDVSKLDSSFIHHKYIAFQIYVRKQLQKFMLTKSSGIIALSGYHKNQITNLLGINSNKIQEIGGGINPNHFFPSKINKKVLKEQMGFSNKKIVTIVSRIEPRKGIAEAIEAMQYIVKKVDALLLIVSPHYDGTFLKYLATCYELVSENNLGGKVLFKTGLTKGKLRPYYQLSDCFLMPSISLETFGLTMIEAIASGTPVIGARNTGNIEEILNNIDPYLLAEKPDPKLFAKKVSDYLMLTDVHKRKIISKGIGFSKKYMWSRQAIKLERYFYQVKSRYYSST